MLKSKKKKLFFNFFYLNGIIIYTSELFPHRILKNIHLKNNKSNQKSPMLDKKRMAINNKLLLSKQIRLPIAFFPRFFYKFRLNNTPHWYNLSFKASKQLTIPCQQIRIISNNKLQRNLILNKQYLANKTIWNLKNIKPLTCRN